MGKQVIMPEKKDSLGQGLQVFQAAKSIYDMKNGKPSGDPASSTSGADTAMSRRAAVYGSTV